MDKNIGIIGLGRIGMPAAKAYIDAGYKVYGNARRQGIIAGFESIGGIHLASPDEVARHVDIVLVLVLNDEQVIEVIAGRQGLLNGLNPGSTIVCMSTINRKSIEHVAKLCADRNTGFIDCPFTGGPARVPNGSLTLIAAAPLEMIKFISPVLNVIGKVVHVGEQPGLGQAVKHCNQLLVGATHAAVLEVIVLARKLGLDPVKVCEVIGGGIAGSDYFRLLSESVLTKKPSPGGLGQMAKDMSIVVNTARGVNMPAYVATAVSQYFSTAISLGMHDMEGAELIRVVERTAGLKD
ncbi:MAG TPA: NAD(P)-dependent oxidoreductase [Cyclobacteriaceae bacterium]|nr:NAD(P)-dependent oxidoreductase [Cyclobacteriaceae bacterium]